MRDRAHMCRRLTLILVIAILLIAVGGPSGLSPLSVGEARAADPAWVAQSSGTTARLKDVFFLDAARGWVVGSEGVILRTDNGGRTWTKQTSGSTANLINVEFVDQNNGWALGTEPPSTPVALKTTNGGTTWTRVALPPNLGGNPQVDAGYVGLALADANTVWVSGSFGTVLRTQNAGQSWERQDKLGAGGTFSVAQTIYGVHFRDRSNGCAVGSGYVRVHTSNGGATWSPTSLTGPPLEAGIMLYNSLTFMTPLEGWAHMHNMLTNKRGLIRTADGGVTWQTIFFTSERGPSVIAFASTSTGWGLDEGALVRTIDGGSSWTTQVRPGTSWLRSLFFLPAMRTGGSPRGWCVGDSGTILAYGGSDQPADPRCFLDVPSDHRYLAPIEGLCRAGVIDGYPVTGGKEFRPENRLFRSQFAKMILGVLEIGVSENDWLDARPPFTDLGTDDPTNLYPHDFVAKAYALRITNGKTASTFAPYTDITRAQVITMVVRAAKSFKASSLAVPPAGWRAGLLAGYYTNPDHGENVRTAEYNGLLAGIAGLGATWNCGAPASRGEAAQIMWNLYRLEGGTAPVAQLLFSDDFSSKVGGWPESGGADHQFAYDTGQSRYTINVDTPHWLAWTWLPASYSDFTAEVRAACLSAGKEGIYGLIFRVSGDGRDMYQFLVSNQGYWQLWRLAAGSRTPMTDVRDNPSGAIQTGTAWNQLRVTAKGPSVNMFLNGTHVCELSGAVLTAGRAGLASGTTAAGGVRLGFDDYKIWSAP